MLNRFAAAIVVASLALAGLAPEARAQQASGGSLGTQGLSQSEADGIKSMIEAWTKDMVAGDFAGWEKYWTADPVLAAPGAERMVGKADITAFARKAYANGNSYSFENWSIAGREDLAVVTNTVTWGGKSGGSTTYNQMIVLRREHSGDWRVQSVLLNTPS